MNAAPAPEKHTDEAPHGLLARHGAAMARHAKVVVIIGTLLAVGAYLVAALGVGGQSLLDRLELGEPVVAGEALEGRDLLRENDPTGSSVQALWEEVDAGSAEFLAGAAAANADLAAIPGVTEVLDPTTIGSAAYVLPAGVEEGGCLAEELIA